VCCGVLRSHRLGALPLRWFSVDLLQRTRVLPSRTKGLTSDLSQVGGSAGRVQDMLTTMLAYIDDVMVSVGRDVSVSRQPRVTYV